ncbi:HNH endonuclease [Romboutsia hominis]|uniref:HNH endonuclease n=1 Tax=Romboutsia hominis TaxID=1507512 RepID=UPI001F0584A2|nr:HNH endonuclease [Romboutsia hominis]MCH1969511.1 HNH endonuclease [Romboutsia hominis]
MEYDKRRYAEICELCGIKVLFKNSKGYPYLEVQHIVWLSNGGYDIAENTVALCPNCYRKMHVLNLDEDVDYLLNKNK